MGIVRGGMGADRERGVAAVTCEGSQLASLLFWSLSGALYEGSLLEATCIMSLPAGRWSDGRCERALSTRAGEWCACPPATARECP